MEKQNKRSRGKGLTIVHDGVKKNMDGRTMSYVYPQDLITAIFNIFNGYDGNEIKLLLALIGNKGDGDDKSNFCLSMKTAQYLCGMSKTPYYNARNRLEEMGLISIKGDRLIVRMDKILKQGWKEAEKRKEKLEIKWV